MSKEEANTFSMMLYMPSVLFCGFIVNQESLNIFVTPFKFLSIHRYSFQALGINDMDGLKLECKGDCNPLPSLGIGDDFWVNILMQSANSLLLYSIGLAILYFRGRKKYMKGKKVKNYEK